MPVETESVRIRIDRERLSTIDAFDLTEPVWWTANTEDPKAYEESLTPFTRPQRLINAIHRYMCEVDNGGHGQFYDNSSGIVWQDALAGFELLNLDEHAAILRESAERLGGNPPLDRHARHGLLRQLRPDFGDLQQRFYAEEKAVDVHAAILAFARSNPEAFLFDGVIQRKSTPVPLSQFIFWADGGE